MSPIAERQADGVPRKERRTPAALENAVLAVLEASQRPLSAYEIAANCALGRSSVSANQIYRTMARLIANGRASRIETLSAYVARREPFDLCMVCETCHAVAFLPNADAAQSLSVLAARRGFDARQLVLEIKGYCSACRTAAAPVR